MLLRENSNLESIFEYTPGFYFNPSDKYADIVLEYSESVTWDISNGENVQIVDQRLVPIVEGPAVLQSQIISLTHLEVIGGSKISWEGVGVTVETSFDLGVTWRPLTNGSPVPNIVNGANVSDIAIIFRETITGYLESLEFVVYGTTTIFSADNPAATIVTGGSLSVSKYPVILGNEFNNGLVLDGSYARLKLPHGDSRVRGIEMWVQQIADVPGASILDVTGVSGAMIADGAAVGNFWNAAYVNGQPATTINLIPGAWTQVVLAANSEISSDVTINSNSSQNNSGRLRVGPILVHQEVPVPAEVRYRYDYAYDQHKVRIIGEALTLSDQEVRVYDLDWTVIEDTGY